MSRLQDYYKETVVPQLKEKFSYSNIMEVPRLTKIVVNIGLGEALTNSKAVDAAVELGGQSRTRGDGAADQAKCFQLARHSLRDVQSTGGGCRLDDPEGVVRETRHDANWDKETLRVDSMSTAIAVLRARRNGTRHTAETAGQRVVVNTARRGTVVR